MAPVALISAYSNSVVTTISFESGATQPFIIESAMVLSVR